MSIDLTRPKVQMDGTPQVSMGTRIGKETIYATHNLCDETTWYSESVRVTEETLSDDGAGTVWSSANACWIDMFSGKVMDDDGLRGDQSLFDPDDPHEYKVLIESSGDAGVTWDIEKQRPPLQATGGDFTVDYKTGKVTFGTTRSGKLVRASYSHKDKSGWILRPVPGRMLTVEKAEIQFSEDIDFNAILVMRAKGWVEQFAPDMWDQASPSGGLWYPSGSGAPAGKGSPGDLYYDEDDPQLYTWFEVAEDVWQWVAMPTGPLPAGYLVDIDETLYKNVAQMLDESVGTFPVFPDIGGDGSVGGPVQILQFHYGMAKLIFSSLGMQIYVGLTNYTVNDNSDFVLAEHTSALGGTRATGTFYMPSHVDPGATQAMAELTQI